MKSYKQLTDTFEELCEKNYVSPPVGPSQELTKQERISNIQGMAEKARQAFPDNEETEEFLSDCEEFLANQ
jgi:hypothetical protein